MLHRYVNLWCSNNILCVFAKVSFDDVGDKKVISSRELKDMKL